MPVKGAQLEMIAWLDHVEGSAHWRVEDDTEPVTCYSIGWVVEDNPEYVKLVPHIIPEEGIFSSPMCIVAGAIVERTVLEEPGDEDEEIIGFA